MRLVQKNLKERNGYQFYEYVFSYGSGTRKTLVTKRIHDKIGANAALGFAQGLIVMAEKEEI